MAVATVSLDQQNMDPPAPAGGAGAKAPALGLAHWMHRVLAECDEAGNSFAPDPVHDLRVAIRRCRSLGEGMKVIDYAKGWQDMRSEGKVVFQALGELRDVQVMQEWTEKLGSPEEPATLALKSYIFARESELKKKAMSALHDFDRKQWQAWSKELPRRAARIRPGSVVFQHMALERWTAARNQQRAALRNKGGAALHKLRILIKKFRYTVENFLPEQHGAWGDDLKKLQDWLGEVHDLDVLWATALGQNVFVDEEERSRWGKKIQEERQKRVDKYKEKMLGAASLWAVWRAGLPKGPQVRAAAMERLKMWASFMDPDFEHSLRVAELARQVYQGIEDGKGSVAKAKASPRIPQKRVAIDRLGILVLAAWLHDIGRFKKERGHHKVSAGEIRKLAPPQGISQLDLRLAAFAARYHRGILPMTHHCENGQVPVEMRPDAFYLAGILRFANAFDASHSGRVTRIKVQSDDRMVCVYARGYSPYSPGAGEIASARFLLERSLRKTIAVKPLVERKTRRAASGRR
jgi:CHAD domain-containing protein